MSHKKTAGFTLLEILFALFIFTIISFIMVRALHTVLTNQSETEKKAARLSEVQFALLILSRDIEQTLDYPITDAKGEQKGFVGTATTVTFTHTGLANPLGLLRQSTLQRTQYALNEGTLVRVSWLALHQTQQTPISMRELISNVTDLHFEYLDNQGRFQKSWPPPDAQQAKNPLPNAVRVVITIKDWGKITQLYLIPGQALEKPK